MTQPADDLVDVLIVGTGNAALCAALAALEAGASVLLVDAAGPDLVGGNSRYTAGAMRFAFDEGEVIRSLVGTADPRSVDADFGSYPKERFASDLVRFNDGEPLSTEQHTLVTESTDIVEWLVRHGVRFEPIWDRQSVVKDGRRVFWGGLAVAAVGEGVGLVDAELEAVTGGGGQIRHSVALVELATSGDVVTGIVGERDTGEREVIRARSVVLACGGFEADRSRRVARLGPEWAEAKVRGTPHNTGVGIVSAVAVGAVEHGSFDRCHATPMDLHMPDYGGLDLVPTDRKRHRKICYFLGVMLNAHGLRFVDEGIDFRNYTYAQFGRTVLEQPGQFAWQVFDAQVDDLLYDEYRFRHASFVEAPTLAELVMLMDGVDADAALRTLTEFNDAVDVSTPFDPTVLDGRSASGVEPPKSNWARRIEVPPFRAYPVTGGITFTYGGLKVDDAGAVERADGSTIDGLFAAGELVGGVFTNGYPGGSGLTSGAVFGRRAGRGAAGYALEQR